MSLQKKKLLVVYEDAVGELESLAKDIKKSVGASAIVKVRCAADVSIPEILTAEAYIFGVADSNAFVWTELRRVFEGINLAGRNGLIYSVPGVKHKAPDPFLSWLQPTELSVSALPCTSGSDALAWLRSI